ncbi:GNAT family N-acetyltransferase [Mucilaginibacter flavidus]|uniref:GNAT family N-acetyltransferase n=1 Tax=Mucilaginibacter flavidus TaxID=2949309 RepID=UPI00209252C3|nr:GNAT family N-acetyltransferase [Mucilaginibacter flavidus]MCO5947542.1 GNAT family N-acetyltransferase [Mucilaginibacter flavidus]
MYTVINDEAFLKKNYKISTDKGLLDFELIYNYLDQESYWAQGIPAETLKKAIKGSLCFGVYHEGKQAGFARVVTDNATFAYICDVFILSGYRRIGLSKWLVQTIVKHPGLQGLRRWSLATADAHGLYKQFGFSELSKPQNWMEIHAPYKALKTEKEEL